MSADADRYEPVTAVFTDRVAGCPRDRLLAGLDGREAEPLLTGADLEATGGGRPRPGRRRTRRPGPGDAVGGRFGTVTLEQLTAAR